GAALGVGNQTGAQSAAGMIRVHGDIEDQIMAVVRLDDDESYYFAVLASQPHFAARDTWRVIFDNRQRREAENGKPYRVGAFSDAPNAGKIFRARISDFCLH